MATTTTNFGWDIPQSTDLVKDGATAIAALGQDIDTAFVDLKGGTTGQVLAKASGTDLDYTWVNPEVGDITAVTAGTGLTGGGTSGAVSLAFDQTNYGGGQFSAGKNKIINGDFSIWQRGTSFSNPSPTAYTADRWQVEFDGTGATRTVSQQTFTPGAAPVAGYEGQYFYRYAVTAVGTGNTYQDFRYNQEDVRTLAGQTATISFWAKADASRVVNLLYRTVYGSGGSPANQFSAGSVTLTTSWARYSVTYAVPSVSGLTLGAGSYAAWIFRPIAATAQTIDIWGVQVEAGSTATPFQTASGSIGGELDLCQRYYWKVIAGNSYGIFGLANGGTTTQAYGYLTPDVTMRAMNSLTSSNIAIIDGPGSGLVAVTLSIQASYTSTNLLGVVANAASGIVAQRSYLIQGNNNGAAFVAIDGEF